ncbi:MAG: glycosyltransferase family 4 protein [Akkermansiaceae bacterium]
MATSISNPKLKIEVVTDTYVPDINGVAISLGRLVNGLRQKGHDVTILRSGKANGTGESSVFSWPLPGYWEISVGAPWLGQIKRRWRKNRPDVIYIAIETPLGFSAMSAAQKLKIPALGGFHTNFKEYLADYGMGILSGPVGAYQKWFHSRLHNTLVPSPGMKEKLMSSGFKVPEVVGRGVDTKLYSPAKRSLKLRKQFGAEGDTPIALVVGRVSGEKNIELAIKAFAKMLEIQPNLVPLVVGNGPIRKKLARANPSVRFPGYITGEDLAECYASCDMLLFPSETETFGNVTLEAMASGLPLLAYDYAAAAWHGIHEENCLKVQKGDETAFLENAERLLNPEIRRRLGSEARKKAEELSWEAVVADFEYFLRQAVNEG